MLNSMHRKSKTNHSTFEPKHVLIEKSISYDVNLKLPNEDRDTRMFLSVSVLLGRFVNGFVT